MAGEGGVTPLPDGIRGRSGQVIADDPWPFDVSRWDAPDADPLADIERWRTEAMGRLPSGGLTVGWDLGVRDESAVVIFSQSGGQIIDVLRHDDPLAIRLTTTAAVQRHARSILTERVPHLPDRQKPTRRGRRRARGRGK